MNLKKLLLFTFGAMVLSFSAPSPVGSTPPKNRAELERIVKAEVRKKFAGLNPFYHPYSTHGDRDVPGNNPLDLKKGYHYNKKDSRKFERLIAETFAYSKTKDTCAFILDKAGHTGYFIKKGEIKRKFPLAMGFNHFYPKVMAGDYASPEGRYQITQIKDGRKCRGKPKCPTKFDLFFSINYPNREDVQRYRKLKKQKKIPRGRGIGSAIGLHSWTIKGINDTLGCFGIPYEVMNELFKEKCVQPGTVVTSVGWGMQDKY